MVVRGVYGWLIALLRRMGVARVRMILVGGAGPAARIVRRVQAAPELGYTVVGMICDGQEAGHVCQEQPGVPLLGHIAHLPQVIRRFRADELIITVANATQEELFEIVGLCDDLPVNIRIYPEVFQLITTNEVSISALTGLPLVSVKDVALRGINRVIKRSMDIVFSSIILILISPFMLLLALFIKLTDPDVVRSFTLNRGWGWTTSLLRL